MFQGKEWGLILSGGGGKGAYEVGVIRALSEADVNIVAVSGASVGALNAALFACYDSTEIIHIWNGITPEIALSQERLGELIRANGIPTLIGNSAVQCYVNAYNILTGHTEYFCLNKYGGEDVVRILLASCAMPIVYPPVPYAQSMYWDGGILDNMPIEILYKKGFRDLIAIYLSPSDINEEYKDANVVAFAPSEEWGFLTGTLNFEPRELKNKMLLGYVETRRKLNLGHHKS